MTGVTGYPFSAYRIAGASACASVIVPYFFSSASQPASAPGTVTVSAPRSGISFRPRASSASRVMSAPARPLALIATSRFSFAHPHHREHVAAQARHHRLDHGEHGCGGDGGVDRVAARLQHGEPGGAGEWLTGCHDAVRCIHHRASCGGERTLCGEEHRRSNRERQNRCEKSACPEHVCFL